MSTINSKASVIRSILFILVIFIIQKKESISAQWVSGGFTNSKHLVSAASNEKFIVFAGGNTLGFMPNGDIDIYYIEEETWIHLSMSTPRADPAVVIHEDLLFIAGGVNLSNFIESNIVDIINLNTLEQSVTELSQARHYISALAENGKVYFAGGGNLIFNGSVEHNPFDVIDVYTIADNSWSTLQLSEARTFMGSVNHNGKLYFAGGLNGEGQFSDIVEIYDVEERAWSIDRLSIKRGGIAAAVLNNKIYFAGGNDTNNNLYNTVDIYDVANEIWTIQELGLNRTLLEAVVACEKLYFIGGSDINWSSGSTSRAFNHIDIYDSETNTWTTDELPGARTWFGAASSQNVIMVAGGWDPSGLGLVGTYNMLTCENLSTSVGVNSFTDIVNIFPNPNYNGKLNIQSSGSPIQNVTLYDLQGNEVLQRSIRVESNIKISFPSNIPSGSFFVKVGLENGNIISRKIIML